MSFESAGPEWLPLFALLVAACLALALWIGRVLATGKGAANAARARSMGRRGERRALRALERAGYRIVDLERTGYSTLLIDGQAQRFAVRADAVVTRRGRTFVAELKGGPKAADIKQRATRRQLLEYLHAFDCEAVLLVDGQSGSITRIEPI